MKIKQLKIQLQKDVQGFPGMGVNIPYQCSKKHYEKLVNEYVILAFPNGTLGSIVSPIYDTPTSVKELNILPLDYTKSLGGKKGEWIHGSSNSKRNEAAIEIHINHILNPTKH